MNLGVLKTIVVPHGVRVAIFLLVSGGLTALLNNIASLNLTPTEQMLVMAVLNVILAGVKKYSDEKDTVVN